jgi:hypothetical protein
MYSPKLLTLVAAPLSFTFACSGGSDSSVGADSDISPGVADSGPGVADADSDGSPPSADASLSATLPTGFYAVLEHEMDTTSCSAPGQPVTDGEPYFEIYNEYLAGTLYQFLHSCESLTDCSGGGEHFYHGAFLQPRPDGVFHGFSYIALYQGSTCTLKGFDADITPEGSDRLRLDLRASELELTIPEADCSGALVPQYRDAMHCVERRWVYGEHL